MDLHEANAKIWGYCDAVQHAPDAMSILGVALVDIGNPPVKVIRKRDPGTDKYQYVDAHVQRVTLLDNKLEGALVVLAARENLHQPVLGLALDKPSARTADCLMRQPRGDGTDKINYAILEGRGAPVVLSFLPQMTPPRGDGVIPPLAFFSRSRRRGDFASYYPELFNLPVCGKPETDTLERILRSLGMLDSLPGRVINNRNYQANFPMDSSREIGVFLPPQREFGQLMGLLGRLQIGVPLIA